jgi:hypothetical protein
MGFEDTNHTSAIAALLQLARDESHPDLSDGPEFCGMYRKKEESGDVKRANY